MIHVIRSSNRIIPKRIAAATTVLFMLLFMVTPSYKAQAEEQKNYKVVASSNYKVRVHIYSNGNIFTHKPQKNYEYNENALLTKEWYHYSDGYNASFDYRYTGNQVEYSAWDNGVEKLKPIRNELGQVVEMKEEKVTCARLTYYADGTIKTIKEAPYEKGGSELTFSYKYKNGRPISETLRCIVSDKTNFA